MKKILLLLVFLAPLIAGAQYTLKFIPEPLRPGGQMPFMQFLPPDYKSSGVSKHPLIIFLHGQGETGEGSLLPPPYDQNEPSDIQRLNSTGLPFHLNKPGTTMQFTNEAGITQSFVVLVPQKHKDYFYTYNPDGTISGSYEHQFPAYYVDAMINYAIKNLNVDVNRIYLTGLSLGGGLVWDYASYSDANAKKLAAIVPVSGNPVYAYTSPNDLCNLSEQKIGIRNYVAYDDGPFVASGQQAVDYVNNNCSPLKKAELVKPINGAHEKAVWNTYYDPNFHGPTNGPDLNMYTYMLSNVRTVDIVTPVDLLYFKGKNLSEQNILDWSTTREVNFDRFEILRSSDGKNFSPIATIKGQTGNQSTKNYSFKDKAPQGVSHYQLKQIDKDNTFKLSSVITVNNKNQAFIIEKYPNPVTAQLNISIEGNLFGALELQVLDVSGNLVKKMSIRKEQATWTGFLDVRSLANGMYILQMTSADGRKEVSNFIKK